MKKFVGITLCLLLLVAAIVPTVAMAASAVDTAEDIIYFLNPTAITAVGDHLFVADIIEDNRSAILCYDVSQDEPIYKYTYEINGQVTNLSNKGDNGLYAVLSDKIVEFSVEDSITQVNSWSVTNAVDVTYGVHGAAQIEYILKTNELIRNGENARVTDLTNSIGCVTIGNLIYYLYETDGVAVCKSYDGAQHNQPSNSLNNANPHDARYYLTDFNPKGLFIWGDDVALFNNDKIRTIEINAESCSLVTLFDYNNSDNSSIEDVATQDSKLYILNDKNKVEIYAKAEDGNFALVATIGSDEVRQNVPTEYTSFTLVRSKGYPTNIVFRTSGDNSIENIETEAHEYIVLGYTGDAENKFYYVLIGDKFGWVKKSDGAANVEQDGKLQIVNTKLTQGVVEYKAKFISLNTVWIYPLPRLSSTPTAYTQSASDMTEVTVLQRFTEGETTWYYVEYGEGSRGFVKEENLSNLYLFVDENNLKNADIVGRRKINSTLFEAVTLYDNPDNLTKEHIAITSNGDKIKLYSGTRVTVISEANGVALIQIVYGDGTLAYGYIDANRLIGVNDITTNAMVGLIVLAVAIVLTAILVVVFVQRRKKNATKSDSRPKKEKKEKE